MRYMQGDSPLWWSNTTDEDENYNDEYQPCNNGRIRPCVYEWGDYIVEEQEHYVAGVGSGEIVLPNLRQRKHLPEEILRILAEYPKLLEQGMSSLVACAYLGISAQTYYRWVGEYKNIDFVERAGIIRTGVGEQY
jgi:uncharacterized protein involved in tolerance to divalent cations